MKYPVIYSKLAWKDLEEIYDFISQDSSIIAQAFLDQIDEKIGRLGNFPESGYIPKQTYLKIKGYRILVIGEYLVFYRFKPKQVKIDRIIHGKRRYEFLL